MKATFAILFVMLFSAGQAHAQPARPAIGPPVFMVIASADKVKGEIVFIERVFKIMNGQTVAEEYKTEFNIADCRVITPNGKQVPNDDLWKRLKNGTVVVVSTDGKTPAQPFLRTLNAEALVIMPAPKDPLVVPAKEWVEQGIPLAAKEPVEQRIPLSLASGGGTGVLQSVKPRSYDGDPTDYLWIVFGLKVEKAAESAVTKANKGLRGGVTVVDIRRDGPVAGVLQRGDILVGLDVWETLDAQACAFVLSHCQKQDSKSVKYHIVRKEKLLTGSIALHSQPSVVPYKKVELSPSKKGAKVGRLLEERLAILKELDDATEKAFQANKATFAELVEAKALFLRAEMALCEGGQERLKVHEKIVAFARELEQRALQLHSKGLLARTEVLLATSRRLEAEIALERALNGTSNRPVPPPPPEDDKRTEAETSPLIGKEADKSRPDDPPIGAEEKSKPAKKSKADHPLSEREKSKRYYPLIGVAELKTMLDLGDHKSKRYYPLIGVAELKTVLDLSDHKSKRYYPLIGVAELKTVLDLSDYKSKRDDAFIDAGKTKPEKKSEIEKRSVPDAPKDNPLRLGSGVGAKPGVPEDLQRPRSGGEGSDKRIAVKFDKASWKEVLEWYSDQTGLPFLSEHRPPPGTFSYAYSKGATYSVQDITILLNESLMKQGYVLVPRKQSIVMLKIVKAT